MIGRGICGCGVLMILLLAGCAGSQPEGRDEVTSGTTEEVTTDSAGVYRDGAGLVWIVDDYARALAESKRRGRPLFVNFTASTSTDCRWMEQMMFPRPEIVQFLERYVLVRLHTDRRDSVSRRQHRMMIDRYHQIELPFYALVNGEDSTLATGLKARRPAEFRVFLLKGL